MSGLDDAALDRLLGHLPVPPPPADLAARILAEAQRPDRVPLAPAAPARAGAAGRRRWAKPRWWVGVASINLALVGAAAASIEVAHHGLSRIAALPAALFHPHHVATPPSHPAVAAVRAHVSAPILRAAPIAAMAPPAAVQAPLPLSVAPVATPVLAHSDRRPASPHPLPPTAHPVREHALPEHARRADRERSRPAIAEAPRHAIADRPALADPATAAANRGEAERVAQLHPEPPRAAEPSQTRDGQGFQRGWWRQWRQQQMAQRQEMQRQREQRQDGVGQNQQRPGAKRQGQRASGQAKPGRRGGLFRRRLR